MGYDGTASVSGKTSDKLSLLDSNVLFERLLEFSPYAVPVVDHEGIILRANQPAETTFGHVRADVFAI